MNAMHIAALLLIALGATACGPEFEPHSDAPLEVVTYVQQVDVAADLVEVRVTAPAVLDEVELDAFLERLRIVPADGQERVCNRKAHGAFCDVEVTKPRNERRESSADASQPVGRLQWVVETDDRVDDAEAAGDGRVAGGWGGGWPGPWCNRGLCN